MSLDGSSANGNCLDTTTSGTSGGGFLQCGQPTSSVLFDGIPPLPEVTGNMWANQLFTLQTDGIFGSTVGIIYEFPHDYSGVQAMEVVMFNCPVRDISVQDIRVQGAPDIFSPRSQLSANVSTINISCDSLVRVCISLNVADPVLVLQFAPPPGADRVHLAETKFFASTESITCTPGLVTISPNMPSTSASNGEKLRV